MKFNAKLTQGVLIRRYKRFLADVRLKSGEITTIHCPNTGSMINCAEPGWKVWFSLSDSRTRKYPGTWELVQNSSGDYIGVNTGRANHVVKEAVESGRIKELRGYRTLTTEVRYGSQNSRIDLLLSNHPQRPVDCYVEVKSVTLLSDSQESTSSASASARVGVGMFPDSVSSRGTKHLQELAEVAQRGERAVLFYCVQHTGIKEVRAAHSIDPVYAETLQLARSKGVEVLAYSAQISPDSIALLKKIPVKMA